MVTIALFETGNGIEVGFDVMGAIVRSSATLLPEVAAGLGEALLDHAERALGLGRLADSHDHAPDRTCPECEDTGD